MDVNNENPTFTLTGVLGVLKKGATDTNEATLTKINRKYSNEINEKL